MSFFSQIYFNFALCIVFLDSAVVMDENSSTQAHTCTQAYSKTLCICFMLGYITLISYTFASVSPLLFQLLLLAS